MRMNGIIRNWRRPAALAAVMLALLGLGAARPLAATDDARVTNSGAAPSLVATDDANEANVEVCPYCSTETCSITGSWHRTNLLSQDQVSNKMASGTGHFGAHSCKAGGVRLAQGLRRGRGT